MPAAGADRLSVEVLELIAASLPLKHLCYAASSSKVFQRAAAKVADGLYRGIGLEPTPSYTWECLREYAQLRTAVMLLWCCYVPPEQLNHGGLPPERFEGGLYSNCDLEGLLNWVDNGEFPERLTGRCWEHVRPMLVPMGILAGRGGSNTRLHDRWSFELNCPVRIAPDARSAVQAAWVDRFGDAVDYHELMAEYYFQDLPDLSEPDPNNLNFEVVRTLYHWRAAKSWTALRSAVLSPAMLRALLCPHAERHEVLLQLQASIAAVHAHEPLMSANLVLGLHRALKHCGTCGVLDGREIDVADSGSAMATDDQAAFEEEGYVVHLSATSSPNGTPPRAEQLHQPSYLKMLLTDLGDWRRSALCVHNFAGVEEAALERGCHMDPVVVLQAIGALWWWHLPNLV